MNNRYFRKRHLCTSLFALMVFQALPVHAIDDTQLQQVPLPSLSGEYQYQGSNGGTYAQSDNGGTMMNDGTETGPSPFTNDTMLELQPHCMEEDSTQCWNDPNEVFTILDPQTIGVSGLTTGDILDMDIVLRAPNPSAVMTVRAWLQYNPTILEARSVELTDALPQPIPEEENYDASRGMVRIGGGTPTGLPSSPVAIARVTFRVISVRQDTEISFLNFQPTSESTTAILDGEDNQLLEAQPATLNIKLTSAANDTQTGANTGEQPYGQNPNMQQPIDPSQQQSGTPNAAFGIAQVQNVRITSQGDNVYVGWAALPSNDVAGYNVYYGTVSGRYIQRRTLGTQETSLTIRGLQTGTQYFVAVRAFDSQQQESAFSQEVSVVVGRPETSTAPLTQTQLDNGQVPTNSVKDHGGTIVSGETGASETLAILLIVAAAIGTAFAWRRQLALSPVDHE